MNSSLVILTGYILVWWYGDLKSKTSEFAESSGRRVWSAHTRIWTESLVLRSYVERNKNATSSVISYSYLQTARAANYYEKMLHFPQVVKRSVRHNFISYPDFAILGDWIKLTSQCKSYLLWTLWKENKVIRYEQQLWMFLQQCFCHQEWNTRTYDYSFHTNASNTAALWNSSRFAQVPEAATWCPLRPKKFIHYGWVRVLLKACVREIIGDEYIMYQEAHTSPCWANVIAKADKSVRGCC